MSQRRDDHDDDSGDRTEVVSIAETIARAQGAGAPVGAAGPPALKQLGRYRLERILAQGGMAEIWLAHVEGPGGTKRNVVVKRVRPGLVKQAQAQSGTHIEMFVREAQLLARLDHTNIVRVFEFGVEPPRRAGEPGEHFIAMEHLEGLTLRDVAMRLWQARRPLPIELAVRFVADACLGLDHAHRLRDERGQPANLVHRDVSPDNLFVTRDGRTKLLDFGIAKREDTAALTMAGELKGKVPFLSPEQLKGERIDARTDLWAVGVVLYWLLCGRRPFDGPNDVMTMTAILDQAPRPLRALNPEVPPLLADAVMACLEKDPARRIGSSATLHDTLSMLLLGLTGEQPSASALVAAAEALRPATHESVPERAAVCMQVWPGSRRAAVVSSSSAPALLDAADGTQVPTMQMALDRGRVPPMQVASVGSRATARVSRGSPTTLPPTTVDAAEPATLPPSSTGDSTANGPPITARAPAPSRPTRGLRREPTTVDPAPHDAFAPSDTQQWQAPSSALSTDGDGAVTDGPTPPSIAATPAQDDGGLDVAFTGSWHAPGAPPAALSAGPAVETSAEPPVQAEHARAPPTHRRLAVVGGIVAALLVAVAVGAGLRTRLVGGHPAPGIDAGAPLVVDAGAARDAGPALVVDAGAPIIGGDAAQLDAGTGLGVVVGAVVDAGPPPTVDAGQALDAAAASANDVAVDEEIPDGAPLSPVRRRQAQRPQSDGAFARGEGFLVVQARPWAQVSLDGRPLGATPLPALPLPAGVHRVRLSFERAEKEQTVTVVAGRTAVVQIDMRAP